MKILLVTHIFPPAIDGGSKIIAKIGEYLQSQNNEVLVLTSDCKSTDDFVNPNSTPIQSTSDPAHHIIRLPVYRRLSRPLKFLKLIFPFDIFDVLRLGPVFKFIPTLCSLRSVLFFRPDFIIAGPLPTTIVLYSRLIQILSKALKFSHSKVLILPCFHQSDPGFRKQPLISALKKSDLILTLTNHERFLLSHHSSLVSNRFLVLGAGVDRSLLINPQNIAFPQNQNILFLGNFAAHKGVSTLIDAFSNLSSRYPNLSLTLAGQPTLYWPHLQSQINNLSPAVRSRISLHLALYSTSKLVHYLDSSSLLILPSIQESFGLVFIESWARGKPVIGADIPPVAELISQAKGGLLFKPDSSTDLFSKINLLLSQPGTAKKYGLSGYQYTKNNFTWDKIGQKLCTKLSPLSSS